MKRQIVFPIIAVKAITGGGQGDLFRYRDATNFEFIGKFPKDSSWDGQSMIDDEARRLQRIQGPFVVEYLQPLALQDGRRGFAMELMDGSLADLVPARVNCLDCITFMRGAVEGVRQVHRSGVGAFHGDLKPPNILRKGPTTKLADFGCARGGIGQTQMIGPHAWGTPGYFPPEGFASPAGDVYSLGATFWALLIGRDPAPGELPTISIPAHPRFERLVNGMLAPLMNRVSIETVQGELQALHTEATGVRNNTIRDGLQFVAAVAAVALIIGAISK